MASSLCKSRSRSSSSRFCCFLLRLIFFLLFLDSLLVCHQSQGHLPGFPAQPWTPELTPMGIRKMVLLPFVSHLVPAPYPFLCLPSYPPTPYNFVVWGEPSGPALNCSLSTPSLDEVV